MGTFDIEIGEVAQSRRWITEVEIFLRLSGNVFAREIVSLSRSICATLRSICNAELDSAAKGFHKKKIPEIPGGNIVTVGSSFRHHEARLMHLNTLLFSSSKHWRVALTLHEQALT